MFSSPRLVRPHRLALGALLALAAACSDAGRAPDPIAPAEQLDTDQISAQLHGRPQGCTTILGLVAAANSAYRNGPPSVLAPIAFIKIMGIAKLRDDDRLLRRTGAQLIEFTLRANTRRPLAGGQAAVDRFAALVSCYAGLTPDDDVTIDVVDPGDQPQTVLGPDQQSGVRFAADPVAQSSLVIITPLENGDGLQTRLDKYPSFVDVSLVRANDGTPSSLRPGTTAEVAICPRIDALPPGVTLAQLAARLRVGHQRRPESGGFTVTEPGAPIALPCEPSPVASSLPAPLRAVGEALAPARLEAAFFGGGVTGTVTEFSPFGIVDSEVQPAFGGGVTGTVTEFRTARDRGLLNMSVVGSSASGLPPGCDKSPVEAPVGQLVPSECQPLIVLRTAQGTILRNVPIDFALTAVPANAGAAIARATRTAGGPVTCGAFGAAAATTTNANTGAASVCWRLGTTPDVEQSIVATPRVGGDAPAGVVFAPATITFRAVGTTLDRFVFTTAPAAGARIFVNSPIPLVAEARDRNGARVTTFTGTLELASIPNGFGPAIVLTGSAVGGVIDFGDVRITTPGSNYRITASLLTPSASVQPAITSFFDVVAAP